MNTSPKIKFDYTKCYQPENIVLPEPSFMRDMFTVEENDPLDVSKTVVFHQDDVSLLFNQRRLSQLSQITVDELKSRFDNVGRSDLLKGFSDEEIASVVKSRYIQAPSEVQSWLTYLSEAHAATLEKMNAATETVDNSVDNSTETVTNSVAPSATD